MKWECRIPWCNGIWQYILVGSTERQRWTPEWEKNTFKDWFLATTAVGSHSFCNLGPREFLPERHASTPPSTHHSPGIRECIRPEVIVIVIVVVQSSAETLHFVDLSASAATPNCSAVARLCKLHCLKSNYLLAKWRALDKQLGWSCCSCFCLWRLSASLLLAVLRGPYEAL